MTTRILVVDDSPDDAEQLVSLILQDSSNVEFKLVRNGGSALTTLAENEIDCVLLDYRLENEDGLELLPRLLEVDSKCPVIMLTGQGNETVAAASIMAGASDYMVKHDATGTDLRTAIMRAIERAEMQAKLAVQEQELMRQGRLEALGQLSAGIAHDFNNLLATIRFGVDGARRAPSSVKSVDRLDMVLSTIDRATERAQSLLAFASKQVGRVSTLMCSDVFLEIKNLTRDPISSSCRIEFSACEPDVPVACDHGLLQNALLNLIINSRDAILEKGEDGAIHVSAKAIRDEDGSSVVQFKVEDDGTGISEGDINRVVDPYFSTKRETGGTGLGLSMVHGFVKQNGGSFHISSSPTGTTVSFTIPVGAKDDIEGFVETSEPDAPLQSSRRVLVVEDEVLLARMMKFDLEDAGFQVSISSSAADAVQQLEETSFDALVTDISLGGKMNGFDVARTARKQQPNIKIVGISGFYQFDKNREPDVINDMLAKPFQPSKLLSILQNQSASENS